MRVSVIRVLAVCLVAACALAALANVTAIVPPAAPHGGRVILTGSGLDAPDVAVSFTDANGNAVAARVLASAVSFAEVAVPAAAVSGPVQVTSGGATTSLPFTVAPDAAFRTVTTLALSTKANDNFKALGGVALMPNGTALIADTAHNVVQLVAPGAAPVVIAGQWAKSGYADGAAPQAMFKSPAGIAYDAAANLIYVADTGNNAIRRIAADGTVSTLAGNGQAGALDGIGTAAQFKAPQSVATDSLGNIYVADTGNSEIRRITASGAVTTIAGSPRAGFADGPSSFALFNAPAGIAVDRDGNLFVADAGNNRIRRIASTSSGVTTVAGVAQQGLVDGAAAVAQFKAPAGVAVDDGGNVYVSDTGNGVIRMIANGSVTTLAGDPKQQGYADGSVSAAQFKAPAGLAVAGGVYIADSGNDALRLIVPELRFTAVYPPNGPEAGGNTVRVLGAGFIVGQTQVLVGTTPLTATLAASTELLITMRAGGGQTSITVATPAGSVTLPNCYTYLPPPTVTVVQPAKGRTAGGDTVTISGTNFGTASDTTVTFGSAAATITAITPTTITAVTPANAAGTVDVTVTTAAGSAKRTSGFTYMAAPVIFAFTPSSGSAGTAVTITGQNFDANAAGNIVTIGGAAAAVVNATTTQITATVAASAATGRVTVATAGGSAISTAEFVVATVRSLTVTAPSTSLRPATQQQFRASANLLDGTSRDVTSSATWTSSNTSVATVSAVGLVSALTAGTTNITAAFSGFTATAHVTVQTALALPPISMQGPPVDQTIVVPIADTLRFLYTGPNAIQTGVVPGVLEDARVGVVSGRVTDRNGAPVPGVQVSASHQPQYGQTLTRADGRFDFAVNGGGSVHLALVRNGFISADRLVTLSWNQQKTIDDVVLVAYDTAVTSVALNSAAVQVARGSAVTDSDGVRRATVLFPAGVTATLNNADGTTTAASTLNVRATEFTVGANGPKAMPASLPVSSGYTYCVELSVDEAPAVTFSRPLPVYVENFLGFPVGSPVPLGYFDSAKNAWIAAPDGVVMKILGVVNGSATVDTTGTGVPDSPARLAALAIDDAELAQLGSLYAVGQSLWRARIEHFTPWDMNWPFGPPLDAISPSDLSPDLATTLNNCDTCRNGGEAVDTENQELHEEIPLAGTPYELAYDSGTESKTKYQTTIRVTESSIPTSLRAVTVTFSIAGRTIVQNLPAQPNQNLTLLWDGMDAYGRVAQGTRKADISVAYTYGGVYRAAAPGNPSFGAPSSGTAAIGDKSRVEVSFVRSVTVPMGNYSNAFAGFGSWAFSAQKTYDSIGRTLYEPGMGTRGSDMKHDGEMTVYRFAGNGIAGAATSGIARDVSIPQPRSLAVAPDGTLYFPADNSLIYHVDRTGVLSVVAGNPNGPYYVTIPDGGLATAGYVDASTVAVGADGLVYFNDSVYNQFQTLDNSTIRRIVDGRLQTVVGGGSTGGSPATTVRLWSYARLPFALAQDGTIYVGSLYYSASATAPWTACTCIYRVDAGGGITRIAGGGTLSGDNIRATQSNLSDIHSMTVGPDGLLYFASSLGLTQITSDGFVHVIAGSPSATGIARDGEPAATARLSRISGLTVAGDGTILFTEPNRYSVWAVRAGVLRLLAGPLCCVYPMPEDGTLGRASSLPGLVDVTASPDGTFYIANGSLSSYRNANYILKTTPLFWLSDLAPSSDGKIAYVFDNGRHTRTTNAITGTTIETLGYDSRGYLVTVTDVNGQTTKISRDGAGKPVAVIAPGGQTTTLALDGQGRLQSVANPAGEAYAFEYNASGMLSKLTDPRSGAHAFSYDDVGRLTMASDPAGGSQSLTRSGTGGNFSVVRTTAEGRTTTATLQQPSWTTTVRPVVEPDGLTNTTTENGDGSKTITRSNGVMIGYNTAPDSRFGMAAPMISRGYISMPSGLGASFSSSQQVTVGGDALAVVGVENATVLNGRTFRTTFVRSTGAVTTTLPTGRTQTTTLDTRDRPVALQVPGLNTLSVTYGANGLIAGTSTGNRQTSFSYDAKNRIATITDPLHRTAAFEYDAADRVKLQTLADGRQIAFSYDAAGNVTSVTPPSRPTHAFTFTSVGLLESYTPPSVPNVTATKTSYTWNRDRRLTSVTRPDGALLSFSYDSAGRISAVDEPLGTHRYTYDASNGTLASISAPGSGTVGFAYDGDLLTGVTMSGAVSSSVGFSYDSSFRATGETVNGSNTIAFGYDDDDLLVSAGALTLQRDPANGLLTGTTLGSVTDSYTYNTFGEPTSYSVLLNGATIFTLGYTRDDAGRIAARTESVNGTTTLTSYTYDDAGRLTDVNTAGANTHYGYDANGNRTSVESPSGTIAATYDAQDRLITYNGASYFYSDNGELQKKIDASGTTTYSYDVFGNLRHVVLPDGTVIDYVIDAMNRRVGKKVNGTLVAGWIYSDALHIVAETDGAGAVTKRFVYGSRSNSPDFMLYNGVTYRFISDERGSVRYVIDAASGTVAHALTYDAWGNVLADTLPAFQPFAFAGGQYDSETRLVRFRARDYDGGVARWTIRDPARFRGGDSNLYSYSFSDPVNFVDPSGLDAIVNNTGVPVLVSGNPGEGHGEGAQVYGVVPSNGGAIYGGQRITIGSFATREQALAYAAYIRDHDGSDRGCPIRPDRHRPIRDVDFFYRGANAVKVAGDDQGPITTLVSGANGEPEIGSRENVPAAYWRYIWR